MGDLIKQSRFYSCLVSFNLEMIFAIFTRMKQILFLLFKVCNLLD